MQAKRQVTTLEIEPTLYFSMMEILIALKQRDRSWSIKRLINCLIRRFVLEFPRMSDKQIQKMFDDYDRDREGDENDE